jgi:hypothetical protein
MIEDRRHVVAPSGHEYMVVATPMGVSGLEPQDWPEPVMWVSTAPGLIGIVDWFRHRFQFHGRWRVDVYARDPQGHGQGRVLTEEARNRLGAGDLVAQLADQLQAGLIAPGH